MLSRTKTLLWILAAAIVAGLVIISLWVRILDSEDILLITPVSSNSSTINAEGLEDINGDQFLLSYEILSSENLRALNTNFEVSLRKTNYSYRHLMDYKMLSGSFFTKEDQDRKQKAAVLNKAAAYAMFGSIAIGGRKVFLGQEEYTVAGVIDDRRADDDGEGIDPVYNVYIPASVSGQNPHSFAVQLNDELNIVEVKNKCKYLLVPLSGYQFISFGALTDLVYGVLFIAVKTIFLSILLVLFRKYMERSKANIRQIGILHEQYYFKEIIHSNPGFVMKSLASAASVLLIVLLILNIIIGFINYYLLWVDSADIRVGTDASAFGDLASALQRDLNLSAVLLIGFIIVMALLLSQSFCKKHILYQ